MLAIPLLAAGCGLPLPIVVASYVADGISLVETGKTVSDHVLSAAVDEDCRLWRLMKGEHICVDETQQVLAEAPAETVTVAELPPLSDTAVALAPAPLLPPVLEGAPSPDAAAYAPANVAEIPLPEAKPGASPFDGDDAGFDSIPLPLEKPQSQLAEAFPLPVERGPQPM